MTRSTELRLRPASDADIDRACEIARKAWVRVYESFRQILGDEMQASLSPNWEEEKERQVRSHYARSPQWFWVAELGDQIVGFITYHIERPKHLGVIGNNAVDPAFQGQGIATRMYQHVLDLFREEDLRYAQVRTGLDPGHTPARRAYEKAGFDIARGEVVYHKYLDR